PKVNAAIGTYGNIRRVVKEAIDAGEFSFDLGLTQSPWGYPGVYAANLLYPGELNVWGGNLDIDAMDPVQLSNSEITTRDSALKLADFLKEKVPGFENSRVEYMSTQVGVRYTRRVIGESRPSRKDLTTANFKDAVAKPFKHRKLWIPYGSLIPKAVDNLLVVGRCISTQQDGHAPTCQWPPCISTGEAAGTAAALAVAKAVQPRALDVSLLQKTIVEHGMELE
ncbi:FAD-dependent oxidoreductase, partial [Chloroflexota bacterium]